MCFLLYLIMKQGKYVKNIKKLQCLVVTSSLVLINRCEKDNVRGFEVKKPLCLFPWPRCPFSSLTADRTATW